MNLFHFSPQRLSIDSTKIEAILFIAGKRKRDSYSRSLHVPNVYQFNNKHLGEMLSGIDGYLRTKPRTIVLGEMTPLNALNYTLYFT